MKIHVASRSRARLEPLIALLLAFTAFSFGPVPSAGASGGAGGVPRYGVAPDPSGVSASYDEGIGSLPVKKAPSPYTPIIDLIPPRLLGPLGLVRPYVDLRGNLDELKRVIVDAKGDGVITLHPPAVAGGDWAVGFHGDVDIDLDSDELRASHVTISVRVGSEFSGGVAAACWNGLCTPPVVLDTPQLALPMTQMLESGQLLQSNFGLKALSSFQTIASVDVALFPNGILRIAQSFK